jgi:hypothetical protein
MVREYFGENARLKQAYRGRAAERSAIGKRNELAAQTLRAVALDKSLRQAKSEALLAYPAPGDSSDPLFRCPDICQACRNVGFRSAPPSLDQFLSDAFAKLDAPVGAR